MILSSLLTLSKINLSYLEHFYQTFYPGYWKYKVWNIFSFYVNSNTAYRIFYFSWRLFAKHRTISSWCRILSSRSTSREIRILSISKFFVYFCHSDMDFPENCILTNFSSKKITGENFCSDRIRTKSLLRRFKNIGMVSEKLYLNTSRRVKQIVRFVCRCGRKLNRNKKNSARRLYSKHENFRAIYKTVQCAGIFRDIQWHHWFMHDWVNTKGSEVNNWNYSHKRTSRCQR